MNDENHKMISSSREEESSGKQAQTSDDRVTISSRLWTSLKNPRIVRVSRSFGGKDRHSKVTTVRGLRDRRVRLSVPTAIQLYDLQDKLGLNQPSKVVDWLINAAQHEIDKLPPLEIPPGNLMHFPQSMPVIFDTVSSSKPSLNHKVGSSNGVDNHNENASSSNFNTNFGDGLTMYHKSLNWGSDHDANRIKERENSKGKEVGNNCHELLNNNIGMPYNSYYQLDPSTAAYFSYLRNHSTMPSQEMHQGFHPISMFAPTNTLDSKQCGYFQLASFATENAVTNRPRGYGQSGNSNLLWRDLETSTDHNSKEQHHK